MPRFTTELIPQIDKLADLVAAATGNPRPITEEDRNLLIAWEEKIREKLFDETDSPVGEPHRWRLPDERQSITHRFQLPDPDGPPFKGYLTMGTYADGRLGELFLEIYKEGTFVSGIMDALMQILSISLQYGVPLEMFMNRFRHTNFIPAGNVQGAPAALKGFSGSVLDYLAKYIIYRFPDGFRDDDADKKVASKPRRSSTKAVLSK